MNAKQLVGDPRRYKQVNVNIEAPKKKRISMRKVLDRFCLIAIPTTVALAVDSLLAWAAYATVTHVWRHWSAVIDTSHVQKYVVTYYYRHGLPADIIYCSLLGIVALTVTILCAYWVESWYE